MKNCLFAICAAITLTMGISASEAATAKAPIGAIQCYFTRDDGSCMITHCDFKRGLLSCERMSSNLLGCGEDNHVTCNHDDDNYACYCVRDSDGRPVGSPSKSPLK